MNVVIKEVVSYSEQKLFVKLPFEIYKNSPNWVPPIISDEYKVFSREKNPAFDFCDAKFWIALKNNKCVGRILAIVNHKYNEKTGIKYGRIARTEFFDENEVVDKLFETAESWLKEKGMNVVHGPLGFTNLDTQGLLIEGFEYLASIASVYHLPYYISHFERLGYEKENDWVEFRLTLTEAPLAKAKRGAQIVMQRNGVELINFKTRAEMMPYTKRIFEILNNAFQELPYVAELNEKMVKLYIDKYFNMLNPKFIKVAKKGDEMIGFFVGLPSLSKAMRKANGRLFPFGFLPILNALKKPTEIDMLLTGVLQEYHASGIAVVLISALQEEMMAAGINTMETTGMFETNHNAIANWKNYEHIQHKRRRCFVKKLN
jgi:hypothetical protein